MIKQNLYDYSLENRIFWACKMLELDRKRNEALELLRPVCVLLMKDGSTSNIDKLVNSLKAVEDEILQEIQKYVLFPLLNVLNLRYASDRQLVDCSYAITCVLTKTSVLSTQTFFDVFNPLVQKFSPLGESSSDLKLSEEFSTNFMKCLNRLLLSTNEKVLSEVYSVECMPALGHVITLLLSLAELSKSRDIQILSMDCLLTLLQTNTKFGTKKELEMGNLFAFVLPGISMAVCRIITGDTKQGQLVLSKAMILWARIVTLTLSDSLLTKCRNTGADKQVNTENIEPRLAKLSANRDDKWVKDTSTKLDILIGEICKLVSHSNWRVRISLVELCDDLLNLCCGSLSTSVPKLLEALVSVLNDEYVNVAKKAKASLHKYSLSQEGKSDSRALFEILEENLHALATSLPRQLRMADEETKPTMINLLNGYIQLLGENICRVLDSAPHFDRLSLALVQALELDISDLKIVEEQGTHLDDVAPTFESMKSIALSRLKKYFKNFRNESVEAALLLVCRNLGRYGNICILVDKFLELYNESWIYRPAAVLIINNIVKGAKCYDDHQTDDFVNSSNDLEDVVSMLLSEYLSNENMKLIDRFSETSVTSPHPSTTYLDIVKREETVETKTSLANRSRAVMLVCLLLEGVGDFSQTLGAGFEPHLIKSLYPLVENLGHENIHLSSSAHSSLMQICLYCGYSSLDELIRKNADYLISSVTLRLRHFQLNKRTPRVLCVMLRYCSSQLLPLVQHSITDILDSLDDHYIEELALFMPVLKELVTALAKWFPSQKHANPKCETESQELTIEGFTNFVTDYIRNKKLAEGDFTDDEILDDNSVKNKERSLEDIQTDLEKLRLEKEAEDNIEEEDDETDKKTCPHHIQVVKDVFQRIKNLLSSKDIRVRMQSLDVLCRGCLVLQDNEKELLPQLHQIWPGFAPRFRSDEQVVVIKAIESLTVMCRASTDFLRQRVMKELVPGLQQFMEKQSLISKNSHSAYMLSSNYKLQLSVLKHVGEISFHMCLNGNHLHEMSALCLPYLSNTQPKPLQQASIEAFSWLSQLDPDAMWLVLSQMSQPADLQPPNSDFKTVNLPSHKKSTEFTSNINTIFSLFINK